MSNTMNMAHHAIARDLDLPKVEGRTKAEWQEQLTTAQRRSLKALYIARIAFFRTTGGAYFTKGTRFKIIPATAHILIDAGLATHVYPNGNLGLVPTAHGKDLVKLLFH